MRAHPREDVCVFTHVLSPPDATAGSCLQVVMLQTHSLLRESRSSLEVFQPAGLLGKRVFSSDLFRGFFLKLVNRALTTCQRFLFSPRLLGWRLPVSSFSVQERESFCPLHDSHLRQFEKTFPPPPTTIEDESCYLALLDTFSIAPPPCVLQSPGVFFPFSPPHIMQVRSYGPPSSSVGSGAV